MPEWKAEILKRLAGLNLEEVREAEIIEELAQHLDDRYGELRASGATEAGARKRALAELSDGEWLRRELRRNHFRRPPEPITFNVGGRSMFVSLWQDLRYAARILRKQPGFTLVAVLTLALGIGANTAIFSVVNAVLLRSFPYQQTDQLMMFYFANAAGDEQWLFGPAAYQNLKNQNNVFTDVAAWGNSTWPANLTGDDEPERLQGVQVSASFFQTLGVAATQGRTFLAGEDSPGSNYVVVISYDLWQQRFGGDANIVNRSILLNGAAYQVVGVMPADFRFVLKTDVWTPLVFNANDANDLKRADWHQVARLKPGVSIEQARLEVDNLLRPYLSDPNSDLRANMKPLQTILTRSDSQMLLILFTAVGFVLLIACVNVASLLLARASARRRELAIRAALGAGRGRVVRQLLTESVLLATLGAVCSLPLASGCIQFLVDGLPEWAKARNAHLAMLKLDGWALAYAFALILLTTIIFGLFPAFQASKANLSDALKEGNCGVHGRRPTRFRSLLVITEVALATVLLVGAGLMLKSFWRLSHVDRGFESEGVLTAKLDPTGERYARPEQVTGFYRQLLERVSSLPGVEHAGITNGFLDSGWKVAVAEHPTEQEDEAAIASRHPVSQDYFRAMLIPLRAGRFFDDHDVKGAPPVAIIDETLAHRYFPDENPLGKHLRFEDSLREIVGIVGATRAWKPYSLDSDEVFPSVYLPYQQEQPWPTMALIIRAKSGDPMSFIPAVRRELTAIDKDQPIYSFKPLEQSVAELRVDRRFSTLLLTALGAMAAFLAAIGIYGLLAYTVSQRTQEIGVRLALGAQVGDVERLILKSGMKLTLVGVASGLIASFALTRLMSALLFNVSATDPLTFAAIAVLLTTVALLACYIPARRAAKVDPLVALRYE